MEKGQHKIDPRDHNKVIRELDELKRDYQTLEANFRLLREHKMGDIFSDLEKYYNFYIEHKDCTK